MSSDYRRYTPPTPTDEIPCAELVPAVSRFAQTLKQLVNPEPDIAEALGDLEDTCSQASRTFSRFVRLLSNKLRDAGIRDFESQHGLQKRRLPSVRKTEGLPGEGLAFVREATAARLEGRLDRFMAQHGGSYEGWLAQYRRRQAA